MNQLKDEKSPYLKQHANNPVNWHAWGEEAFVKAQRDDKPIFLSIGYATCHWCHVMNRESFSNEQIAQSLNELFIPIKLDREEYPEVDRLYIEFAQGLLGHSVGWPLNLILTPQLQPFFAATYLPPKSKSGSMGLLELITEIETIWYSGDRELLNEQAREIVTILQNSKVTLADEIPNSHHLQLAVEEFLSQIDINGGGLKGTPKFPMPHALTFALNASIKLEEPRLLFFLNKTLTQIAQGGIHDQLGGGFSRYAIDENWEIPHFEKMLDDNSSLATLYCKMWQHTGNPLYKEVAVSTCECILRDLRAPEGGFYAAIDADNTDGEGEYYTWFRSEAEVIIGPELGPLIADYFEMTDEGNFHGCNVLHTTLSIEEFAKKSGLDHATFKKDLDRCKKLLLKERQKRVPPFVDTKALAFSNGLAIEALALCGFVFNNKRFVTAAVEAMAFVERYLFINGLLVRRYCDGDSGCPANLEDYAALIRAHLTLFEIGLGGQHLLNAMDLEKKTRSLFGAKEGNFYFSQEIEHLLIRKSDFLDHASECSQSMHCDNLLRLYQITHDNTYIESAENILRASYDSISAHPLVCLGITTALLRYLDLKAPTLMITLDSKNTLKDEIEKRLRKGYNPHLVTVWRHKSDEQLGQYFPNFSNEEMKMDQTAVHYCTQRECVNTYSDKKGILDFLKTI